MTSSVASGLFKNHSPFMDSKSSYLLPYGQVFIEEGSNHLLVYDLYGSLHILGNSYRNLAELPGYLHTGNSQGILQFKTVNEVVVLTTSQLQLSIWNLKGTVKPSTTLVDTYLGLQSYNNEVLLTASALPALSIRDLAEVQDYTTDAYKNGWVLTATGYRGPLYRPGTSIPKDPTSASVYYYWSLQPETSSIRYFDDAARQPELNHQIYRIPKPNENASHKYINYDLTIAFDVNPTLSNHLDCNTKALYNHQYLTTSASTASTVITVTIDLGTSNVTTVEGTGVKLINLEINVPITSVDSQCMYSHSLILTNFKGEVSVPSNVRLENGRLPVSLEGDVLLSIIAVNYPIPSICINQKTLTAI